LDPWARFGEKIDREEKKRGRKELLDHFKVIQTIPKTKNKMPKKSCPTSYPKSRRRGSPTLHPRR